MELGVLKYVLMPSGFMALCFLGGLAALLFKRARKAGVVLLSAGSLVYLVLSLGPFSDALLGYLEYSYPRYEVTETSAGADTIVVMAGYAADENYYPLSSKVNGAALFRLVEAYDLWLGDQTRQVVITGGGEVPEIMRSVLVRLGVPSGQILVENRSYSSDASAVNIKEMLGERSFILVTSAGHMPRTMKIFQRAGVKPLPAPTDFMASKDPFQANLPPSVQHLYYSEMALHELVAMVWYRIKGTI